MYWAESCDQNTQSGASGILEYVSHAHDFVISWLLICAFLICWSLLPCSWGLLFKCFDSPVLFSGYFERLDHYIFVLKHHVLFYCILNCIGILMARRLASTQLSCFCLVLVQNKSANIDPHASSSAFMLASALLLEEHDFSHTTALAITVTWSALSAKAPPPVAGDFAVES